MLMQVIDFIRHYFLKSLDFGLVAGTGDKHPLHSLYPLWGEFLLVLRVWSDRVIEKPRSYPVDDFLPLEKCESTSVERTPSNILAKEADSGFFRPEPKPALD